MCCLSVSSALTMQWHFIIFLLCETALFLLLHNNRISQIPCGNAVYFNCMFLNYRSTIVFYSCDTWCTINCITEVSCYHFAVQNTSSPLKLHFDNHVRNRGIMIRNDSWWMAQTLFCLIFYIVNSLIRKKGVFKKWHLLFWERKKKRKKMRETISIAVIIKFFCITPNTCINISSQIHSLKFSFFSPDLHCDSRNQAW